MADDDQPRPKLKSDAPAATGAGDGTPRPKIIGEGEPEVFKSTTVQANRAVFALGANLLFAAINLVLAGAALYYLAQGGTPKARSALDMIEMIEILAGLGTMLAVILAAVFFLVWLHRSVRNLEPLNVEGYPYTPGWAVGWWFIPFANMVMPYLAVHRLWKASVPGFMGEHWKDVPVNPMLPVWWALWLVSNIAANVALRGFNFDRLPTPAEMKFSYWSGIVSDATTLAGGLLCIVIVLQIDENQMQKAEELGLPG